MLLLRHLRPASLLLIGLFASSLHATPFGYTDPDAIKVESSVLLYRCSAEAFHLWLAPAGSAQPEDRELALDSELQPLCESRGNSYAASTQHYRGDAERGFCAGAQAVSVQLLRNGQPLYRDILANYCTLSGTTELHFLDSDTRCVVTRQTDGAPINSCGQPLTDLAHAGHPGNKE